MSNNIFANQVFAVIVSITLACGSLSAMRLNNFALTVIIGIVWFSIIMAIGMRNISLKHKETMIKMHDETGTLKAKLDRDLEYLKHLESDIDLAGEAQEACRILTGLRR